MSKVDFLDPFADTGRAGGRLCLPSLRFWCDAKKPWFFEAFPMGEKIQEIGPWGAQGPQKGLRVTGRGAVPRPLGP